MDNKKKYQEIFTKSLAIGDEKFDQIKYNEIPEWDQSDT